MLKILQKILLFSLLVFVFNKFGYSQNRINSPYSRFGVGEIQHNQNSRFIALGGTSLAYKTPNSVNFLNPASYSVFDTLSFIFEGGLQSNFSDLETSTLSQKSNYTSMSHLTFGFPITHKWKASFGLLPYSSVGYKVSDYKTEDSVGNVKYIYDGQGGINQFFVGQAYSINKNLSIGLNVSYLFGSIEKSRTAVILDSVYTYNVKAKNTTNYGVFKFDFGLQYFENISKDMILGAGFIYSLGSKSKTKEDFIAYTFSQSSTGYEYIHDTASVLYIKNKEGEVKLPMSYGLGLSFEKKDVWIFGVDFSRQNWTEFLYNNIKDSLDDSWRLSVGFEIKPDFYSTKYFKRVSYRAGVHYEQSYLNIRNENIDEFGISFGLGLPLRKSKSTLNLAIEFGKKGTIENGLIKENFTKISIGFSAYDYWFFKRKYD